MHVEDDWRSRAACAAQANDLFFPAENRRTQDDLDDTREAKILCGRCEVRRDCLVSALRDDVPHGVWGGLTTRERRALKKRMRRARAAA